jgi:hypothetical protein
MQELIIGLSNYHTQQEWLHTTNICYENYIHTYFGEKQDIVQTGFQRDQVILTSAAIIKSTDTKTDIAPKSSLNVQTLLFKL